MPSNPRFAAFVAALFLTGSETLAQCQPGVDKLSRERKFEEARTQMQAVVAKNANDDAAWECLGRIASAMDRQKEASGYFEKAIKINDNVATHHLWLGNALGDLADSTSKIKLPFLARRIKSEFERTVALDPSSVDGRSALVEFYTQAPGVMGGSKEKAQEQIREIIKLNPMRGHWKQADLYMRDKNIPEAEKEYIAAVQASPDSSAAAYTLGMFYQNNQKWTEAFGVYDRMEKRFPTEWAVRFNIGRTAALSGEQLDRGEKEFRALLASPPADMSNETKAGAHHRLGMILEKQGKKEQARGEYTTAVSINPKNEAAKKSLAALK
jgi:tetratricopeptide (TPR) repeat protein